MQNGSSHRPMEEILPCPITIDSSHSPLHEAAITGNLQQLEQFLRAGADRNAKDAKHGNTPLHEAAWRGYSKCVKALCVLPKPSKDSKQPKSKHLKDAVQNTHGTMHSSLLGTRNAGGFSPLHLAAQNGHNQSCREILLAGGDPDVQNNYGDTPLHTACRYGHAGATRILLSAKCDPKRVNLNGDTPLHISCAMGRRKLTRILLYAGSSLKICNSQGETARDIAIRKKLPEILQILDTPIDESVREKERDRSSSSSRHNKKDDKKTKKCDKTKCKGEVDPKNWSPYGCHYFPDPRSFPSPKLESLPKEPLNTGEQYFLDLAGNIRKGPVGVGNTCYCGPFFRHIEERISRNKKSIRKYVHKATEKLDSKVQALAMKTEDQIDRISKNMLADRIRCDEQRLNVEQWLKRGDRSRATVSAHTQKSRKDETNTNTLTRCRSLELLDNNNLIENIELLATGLRRSYDDILDIDTHQAIVHYDAESGTRSTHGTVRTDSDRRNSMLEFNKEWHNQDLDKDKSSISDKNRISSSEQDRNSLENRSDSDLSKRIKKMELRSGISVAERLEELLSKTNEIIEMERSCRKKSKDVFGALNTQISKRRIRGSEHLRVSASSNKSSSDGDVINQLRNQSKHYSEMDDTAFIAKEMEKITSSLLGHGKQMENMEKHSPVSPEIAKEFISQKERNGHIDNEHEHSSILSGSSYRSVYGADLNKHAQSPSYSTPDSAKAAHLTQDRNERPRSIPSSVPFTPKGANATKFSGSLTADADVVDGFSGFYQNSCFDDGNSSDGDTVKSEIGIMETVGVNKTTDNKYQAADVGNLDVDDRCELSEMANMKQLNELKSRILNGGHWRNQLRKSSQSESTTRDDNAKENQVNGIATTYEIKNCEIKTLKSNQQTFADVHGAPTASVANGVETTNLSNGISYGENHDSESSEDEDEFPSVSQFDSQNIEKSLRYLDALKPQRVGNAQGSSLYVNQSYKMYSQPEVPSSTPMYHLTKPQQCNGASNISQSFKSPVPKIIDTRCLIPKDAYFHDLPNKHRLIPITDTLPEINYSPNQMTPTSAGLSAAGRNRNPLPISVSIDESEFHNDAATHYSNTVLPSYGNLSPYQYQTPHQLNSSNLPSTFSDRPNPMAIGAPEQEKLLTNRKFGLNLDTDFKNHTMMGSTYSIDQVQLERDSNNDSGYSTKVSGSIGSRPSPSLSSGQTDIETSKGNDMRRHYDGYYMPGASSLV